MKFGTRVVVYLILAGLAVAGVWWSVLAARVPVEVAPVADGEPTTFLTAYDGAYVARALALTAVAGTFLVLAISRGVRDHRSERLR